MKWINYKKRIFRRIGKSLGKIGIFAGIICFAFYGMSILGGTSSYFSDTEDSNANTFSAGTLDFNSNSGGDFSPAAISKGESTNRTVNLSQEGSLDFQYTVSVDNLSGDACDYLDLTVMLDGSDIDYVGLLKDFVYGPITFSAPEAWIFTTTLQADTPDSIQGKTCNFDFVFDGTQIGGGGFYDQETINNNIMVKYWNPPVVLNEFLPNAGEYPEFIEIYNKTSSDIDLDGFYIMANSKIPIDATTTATYSGGSTVISANNWLVVTTNGNQINDSSGTITLYNQNNVIVDTYVYGASENNVNNTPGWTNNLVAYLPFDIDGSDKSGNGNNGAINGAVFTGGKINQGLSFDGIDDYAEVLHSSSINIGDEKITLEAWVNLNSLPAAGSRWIVLNKNDAYALQVADGGKVRAYLGPLTTYIQTDSVALTTGSWYHLIATYDGLGVNIYVNGLLKKQVAKTGDQATSENNLIIGAKSPDGYFSGSIDEVKIYNRALNDTEIINHYNAIDTGGTVPVDKSYARIPDGSSNWVDPIPTPGQPNVIEEKTETVHEESEEIIEEFESTNTDNISLDGSTTETTEEIINQLTQEEQTTEEQTMEEQTDQPIIEVIEEQIIEEITEETTTEETIEEETTEEITIEEIIEEAPEEVPATEEVLILETEEILATEEQIIAEEILIPEPIIEPAIEPEPIIEPEPAIEMDPIISE